MNNVYYNLWQIFTPELEQFFDLIFNTNLLFDLMSFGVTSFSVLSFGVGSFDVWSFKVQSFGVQ